MRPLQQNLLKIAFLCRCLFLIILPDRDQSRTDTNKIKIKIAVVFKCFFLSVLFKYYFLSPREVVVVLSQGNVRISLVTQQYAAV